MSVLVSNAGPHGLQFLMLPASFLLLMRVHLDSSHQNHHLNFARCCYGVWIFRCSFGRLICECPYHILLPGPLLPGRLIKNDISIRYSKSFQMPCRTVKSAYIRRWIPTVSFFILFSQVTSDSFFNCTLSFSPQLLICISLLACLVLSLRFSFSQSPALRLSHCLSFSLSRPI